MCSCPSSCLFPLASCFALEDYSSPSFRLASAFSGSEGGVLAPQTNAEKTGTGTSTCSQRQRCAGAFLALILRLAFAACRLLRAFCCCYLLLPFIASPPASSGAPPPRRLLPFIASPPASSGTPPPRRRASSPSASRSQSRSRSACGNEWEELWRGVRQELVGLGTRQLTPPPLCIVLETRFLASKRRQVARVLANRPACHPATLPTCKPANLPTGARGSWLAGLFGENKQSNKQRGRLPTKLPSRPYFPLAFER